MKNMIFANTLRLVLDTGSPHEGMLQLLDNCPVNLVAEVLDGAMVGLQDHGGLVVRKLALTLQDCWNHNLSFNSLQTLGLV